MNDEATTELHERGDMVLFPITSLPANKKTIGEFAARIKEELEEGNANALDILRYFKGVEKLFEAVKKELTAKAAEEAAKYGKDEITPYSGVKFELAEVGVSYDYSSCCDPVWQELKAAVEAADLALKERETFLKSIKDSMESVDESTGECFKIYPPLRKSTTSVKTTFL